MDKYDDGCPGHSKDVLNNLNIKKIPKRQAAVAIRDGTGKGVLPVITAAGWGKIAEQIIALAYENGINVREDSALAEMLTKIEVDSPIPSEAFMAVAEILSYVYRANGQPNPFDAVFEDDMKDTE
ncbi:MAG: EscU/YscU/HrcU family type III secretion system export apparatus switch protein [Alphaproteobacteria bacterium]